MMQHTPWSLKDKVNCSPDGVKFLYVLTKVFIGDMA